MQYRSVGTDVHLVGRRDEADGTVLRFQAPTYEQIYEVLPVLLAPLRMSRAVDWTKTLQDLPGDERGRMLTELAKIEATGFHGFWRFADRLSEGFGNFPNAKVKQIRDGRHWAVRIEVATNPAMARKLTNQPKRSLPRSQQKNELRLPGGTVWLSLEDRSMSQEIKAGGNVVAAAGAGNTVTTGDVVFQQVWNKAAGSVDLPKLADELGRLRAMMKQEATEPEHDVATGNVAIAEKAAKEGDGPKALENLKAAGKWALGTATKIGVRVAEAAMTKAIGAGEPSNDPRTPTTPSDPASSLGRPVQESEDHMETITPGSDKPPATAEETPDTIVTLVFGVSISVFFVVLLIIHMSSPQLKIDTTAVGLAIGATLPWFARLLKSADSPGAGCSNSGRSRSRSRSRARVCDRRLM